MNTRPNTLNDFSCDTVSKNAITSQYIIDKRLQGMSFDQIASELNITKSALYWIYSEKKCINFNGYMPIPITELKALLDSDLPFYYIAAKYNTSIRGLNNYIHDYALPPRLTEDRLRERIGIMKTRELCDYFGVSRSYIEKLKKLQ